MRTILVERRTDGEVEGFTVPVGEDVPDMEALGRYFPLSAPKIGEDMILLPDTDPEDVGWPSGHDPDVDEYMADWLDGYTAVAVAGFRRDGRFWRTLIRSSGFDRTREDAAQELVDRERDECRELFLKAAKEYGYICIVVGGEEMLHWTPDGWEAVE